MFRRDFLRLLSSVPVLGWLSSASAAEPGRIAIIANKKNRSRLSETELRALFLTRRVDWPGGKRAIPFNFPARHAVRVDFDKQVLGMNPDEVARYWIDRRIRGGNRPPKQVPSGSLMVRVVERLEGAIGYVPENIDTNKVRVLGYVTGDKIELSVEP